MKDRHLQLWHDGHESYTRRKSRYPNDTVLTTVMNMLTFRLREKTRGFTVDQLLKQYADAEFSFPKEIYRDEWDYYTNYVPKEYTGGDYVILSTFEDAAYYYRYQEIIKHS